MNQSPNPALQANRPSRSGRNPRLPPAAELGSLPRELYRVFLLRLSVVSAAFASVIHRDLEERWGVERSSQSPDNFRTTGVVPTMA